MSSEQMFERCFICEYRLIAGVEDEKVKDDEACFWFCSSKRAVLTSTNRQELKDFTFTTKTQIGLEVEMVEDRVSSASIPLMFLSHPCVVLQM